MDRAQSLEQLETLAETPEAIPKLHALVFDLAIRGRLLPQNQSDEPASSLLEKIRKQKRTAENNSPKTSPHRGEGGRVDALV